MISFNLIWLISLILYVGSFLTIVLIAKFGVKPIDNQKFSFKRTFPYETFINSGKFYKPLQVVLFLFAALSFSPIFSLIGNLGPYENLSGLIIFSCCSFGLAGVLTVFQFFFNPSSVRIHMLVQSIASALVMLCTSVSSITIGVFAEMQVEHGMSYPIPNLVFSFASLFVLAVAMFYCMSLDLKTWPKLIKNNGVLERPDLFPLTCLEWLTLVVLFTNEVLFFLSVIKY